ncbi:peptidoglycan-binding protein [Yinghuangia soli]|uniref:Peptidoglycan-binding protein n=1 Tax=Yinghuangia soli TaxID=2908204 RepID=A0AA41U584_9ACTN|nr:peptidoglycan-binding protein [Yinghuangia soli]MCF2531647.1 peptidoglycan-binding protein [Yinghuangia soli]
MTAPLPGGFTPDDHADLSEPAAHGRTRKSARTRTIAVAGVAAVVALGVGGAVVFAPNDNAGKAASESPDQGATAPVVQGDLTVNAEVDGTLGYGGTESVFAQSPDTGNGSGGGTGGSGGSGGSGGGAPGGSGGTGGGTGGGGAPDPQKTPGNPPASNPPSSPPALTPEQKERKKEEELASVPRIFTGLPKVGDVIERGGTMFSVNGRPVPLFYGGAPLWRALEKGVADGPDVEVLESNLAALGFGKDLTIDRKFTEGTAAAVKRWQKSLGMPQTGRVDPSAVAVQSGPVRVTQVKAAVGGPAQGEVATVSGTGRRIDVKLPVDKQGLAKKGDKVTVRLPDGKTTAGTVSEIGTVAEKEEGGGMPGAPGGGGKATIKVTVTLDKPEDAGSLDGAPVSVGFTSQSRKGVLSVPVNALVALAEGGYAVEVVDPATGGRKLVGVKTGLFANGRVEVSGEGLGAGQKVRVPA